MHPCILLVSSPRAEVALEHRLRRKHTDWQAFFAVLLRTLARSLISIFPRMQRLLARRVLAPLVRILEVVVQY